MSGSQQGVPMPAPLVAAGNFPLVTPSQVDGLPQSLNDLDSRASALEAGQTNGLAVFATWPALAAFAGTSEAQGAEVDVQDTGTHTDPVTGETVPNSGRYAWRMSVSRWERLGDSAAGKVEAISGAVARQGAILETVTARSSSVQDGLLAAFRRRGRVYAGIDDLGRRWFAAGQRWLLRSDGSVRWERAAGGARVDLRADGLDTDGQRIGWGGGAVQSDRQASFEGRPVAFSFGSRRRSLFHFGPHHIAVAGLIVRREADGAWSISSPRGRLIDVPATGRINYLGSRVYMGAMAGAALVIKWGNGRLSAFRIEPETGVLQLLGRPALRSLLGGGGDRGAFTQAEIAALEEEASAYSERVRRRDMSALHQPVEGIVAFLIYGQSLSSGWEGWPTSTRAALMYDNLMLGQSINPTGEYVTTWQPIGDSTLRGLVPTVLSTDSTNRTVLTEAEVAALTAGASNVGETPLEGALSHLRAAWLRSRGKWPAGDPANRFLALSAGCGGRTIAQLSEGASPELFNRVRTALAAGKAAADAAGASYAVGGVIINQGEWDYRADVNTSYADYLALLTQLISDIRSAVATVTGQTTLVPIYLSQTGGSYASDTQQLAVGRAQIEAARTIPGVVLATSNQGVVDKGAHLTGNGYGQMGYQLGRAMARTIVQGEGYEATRALRWVVKGTTLAGLFHVPAPPLRIGTPYLGRSVASVVTDPSRGIYVEDAAGAVPVSNVRIVSGQVLLADLGRATSGTVTVWLGRRATFTGAVCLADSDTTDMAGVYRYEAGSGQTADENIADLVGLHHSARTFALADVQTATII